ncbi:NAD(P)H-hydrate epimerase [Agromyces kandeliae]|uniref:NAD(P)H-hydrate epimerase n=1 Tax=Agromyces kandeliae TaxID=2666141 RepID=A0A6L5R0E8_9MICO|nr:NAD(P)H-hydrate epimerase [Agromyces kandeliae]MRX43501.1 NAD(P)H-hydrate epimerase [Agromyces kandeliae]
MDADARSAAPSPRDGYTAEQVRAAERPLLEAGEPLMRRAAEALADEVSGLLGANGITSDRGTDAAARPLVLVLAGSGDNGGDALFAGAHLAARGADVRIAAIGSRLHDGGAEAAHAAGARDLDPDTDPVTFSEVVAAADVLIDGILGIGAAASPALRGRAREVVARVRATLGTGWVARAGRGTRHPLVVAVDLPSGISPDDGRVPDPTVLPADVTVTMGAVKAGLLLDPAAALAGRVVLVDLGLGPALAEVTPVVRRRP